MKNRCLWAYKTCVCAITLLHAMTQNNTKAETSNYTASKNTQKMSIQRQAQNHTNCTHEQRIAFTLTTKQNLHVAASVSISELLTKPELLSKTRYKVPGVKLVKVKLVKLEVNFL